jgi:hypothetical protein
MWSRLRGVRPNIETRRADQLDKAGETGTAPHGVHPGYASPWGCGQIVAAIVVRKDPKR